MRLYIYDDATAVGEWTANYVCDRINQFAPTADRPFVLGLPTGASRVGTGSSPSPRHPFPPNTRHARPPPARRGFISATDAGCGFTLRPFLTRLTRSSARPQSFLCRPTWFAGGTPVPTYRNLVKLHKEGKLSFQHVVTFNMDEYCGLPR